MGWIIGILVFIILTVFVLLLNRGADRRVNDQAYREFADNEQQEALSKSKKSS